MGRSALPAARDYSQAADLPISLVASPYAGMILLGLQESLAMKLHILCALILLGVLVHLAILRTPYRFVMAYLFSITLFVTPHNFTYDWLFVLVALLLVWREARLSGFLPYELAGLFLGYISPFIINSMRHLDLPVAPILLFTVILTVARRAYFEARADATD